MNYNGPIGQGSARLVTHYKRLKQHRHITQLVKYGIVGLSSTILDVGILNLLVILWHWNVYVASTASFLAGVVNGYWWNSIWTFAYKGKKHGPLLAKFTLISAVGLVLNTSFMYVFIHYGHLHYNIAKLIAVVLVFFWNFTGNRYWTFRGHGTHHLPLSN